MKSILLFSTLFLTSFITVSDTTVRQKFICTITTDKPVYKLGELPKIDVQILNNSKRAVYLIGALDGSDIKWRMPYCYFTINKPKPDTVLFARCGNTDPLSVKNFKMVKHGEVFNPFQFDADLHFYRDNISHDEKTFRNPGIYKIQFHYSTNSNDINTFESRSGQIHDNPDSVKLVELFENVPRIDIQSNVIEISFE
jgi:hypothetical protein